MVADGEGALYVSDEQRVRKITLHEAGYMSDTRAGATSTAGRSIRQSVVKAVVTTLPIGLAGNGRIWGLAYLAISNELIIATSSALYRLPLDGFTAGEEAAAAPAAAASADAAAVFPILLAGWEGHYRRADGVGTDARFQGIFGIAAAADGTIFLCGSENDTSALRRVALDGTVTTLVAGLQGLYRRPTILPNGYLAMSNPTDLLLLDLGLKSSAAARTAAAGPAGAPRSLAADLGSLLDRQPDGTSDLVIQVGDSNFQVHRAVLSARSDYFRQRLVKGNFSDGTAAQLSLSGADPNAFALLLEWIYTDAVGIPAAAALAVAELADRLLLPELCRAAQAQVLAGMTVETVVGALLWAERLGDNFSQLLTDLKAWYLEHQEEVAERARTSLERLADSPDLVMDLLSAPKRTQK